jgi:phage shock protein PspC (stress-responsive transcriptional regulator)
VIAGLSSRFGWDVWLLRVLFVVAVVLTGGVLLAVYAFAWVVMSAQVDAGRGASFGLPGGRRGWQLGLGVGLLTLSGLLVFRELGIWWSDAFVWPLVLAVAGATLLWAQTRRTPKVAEIGAGRRPVRRPGPEQSPTGPDEGRFLDLYRGGFGIALVIGAALLFLSQNDALGAARDAAFTAIVAIFALALILAPFIWRLGRNLATERSERIRSQERAEMAAHLHDSVLQTLTLMQKRADDPREVSALARRQERELRDWLAGEGRGGSERDAGGFAAALRSAAEEVEDAYLVQIEVVTVGDRGLDGGASAVVGAAREALTNAAKFAAEGGPISVYAEVSGDAIEAYVRDRGPGFEPSEAPADRRGVRESIVGRMQRHGGTATIARVPGAGTEVALRIEGSDE